ncbi:hypothetical protein QR98_0071020 [Sarcoptes scabiei]|uniref:Uncharacterized protein n=1 Tax=Sarcoptes scabiei TaxID=52283 RepID=A0A132ADQ5_SARSC|nr:hypothetical protein QR98_0071020 [Sarcoptes scabiei]
MPLLSKIEIGCVLGRDIVTSKVAPAMVDVDVVGCVRFEPGKARVKDEFAILFWHCIVLPFVPTKLEQKFHFSSLQLKI